MLVKQKGYSKKHREMVKRIVINYMFKKGELKVHKLKKHKNRSYFLQKNDEIKTILRYISRYLRQSDI